MTSQRHKPKPGHEKPKQVIREARQHEREVVLAQQTHEQLGTVGLKDLPKKKAKQK